MTSITAPEVAIRNAASSVVIRYRQASGEAVRLRNQSAEYARMAGDEQARADDLRRDYDQLASALKLLGVDDPLAPLTVSTPRVDDGELPDCDGP